jgi:hypothetical protein
MQLNVDDDGSPRIDVLHDDGWDTFSGAEASHAAGVVLANSDGDGANAALVSDAVRRIDDAGSVERFMRTLAEHSTARRGRMARLGEYRGLGAMNLARPERLALEMAVNEGAERRALEGELDELEDAWKDAEEIAAICDGPLTPVPLPSWLRGRR